MLLIVNTMMTDSDALSMASKINKLADNISTPGAELSMHMPDLLTNRQFMKSISEVWSSETKVMKIKDAIGMVSADCIRLCPPGYPFLFFGEKIVPSMLNLVDPEREIEVMIE